MKKYLNIIVISSILIIGSCGGGEDEPTPAPTLSDTTPPTIAIASSLAGDNIVSDTEATSLVVVGSSDAENNQTVGLSLSDNVATITASAIVQNGAWTSDGIDISAMIDGPILITADVSDAAGNEAESAQKEITLAQDDVAVGITQPIALDDKIVLAESRVIRVYGTTGAKDGQTVTISFTDGANTVTTTGQVSGGSWVSTQTDLRNLTDGNITISASVANAAGRVSQTSVNNIPLDKTIAPPAPSRAGTIFLNRNIMTADDPSTYVSLNPNGQATRTMFDRRTNSFNQETARLFNATYSDGFNIEIQVNPEFTQAEALVEAEKYGTEIGRLPKVLKRDVQTLWIHRGEELFGGGNNNILIHTETTANVYEPRGNLHETLIHEACHTSLDSYIKDDPEWLYAQTADGTFISEYARDNPNREDIAETFVLYIAYRFRPEVLSETLKTFIEEAMSYRMDYFDKQNLDLAPYNQ